MTCSFVYVYSKFGENNKTLGGQGFYIAYDSVSLALIYLSMTLAFRFPSNRCESFVVEGETEGSSQADHVAKPP